MDRVPSIADARLYGILDLGYVAAADSVRVARALIDGGADLLQLRAKDQAADTIRLVAAELLPHCRSAGIPFIINDFPHLAAELDADGVHLGQDDGCLTEARNQLGPGKLVGRSTHSLDQALAALADGADYIGFGPLFPTPTKAGRSAIGLGDVRAMASQVGQRLPAFCIGGIRRSNLREVIAAGATRAVIVSDLLTAPDVRQATQEAKTILSAADR